MSAHACGTHRAYHLTCQEYDDLRARHDGLCWRCKEAPGSQVDHDHELGMRAVRGHLCGQCNLEMIRVDHQGGATELDIAYLDRAWHVAAYVPHVPDKRTPLRQVRVDDELWDTAKHLAAERRETLSLVIRRALLAYVRAGQEGSLEPHG